MQLFSVLEQVCVQLSSLSVQVKSKLKVGHGRLIAGFTYFYHKEILLLGHPSRVILELVGTS